MATSTIPDISEQVQAKDVKIDEFLLRISLSDGRELTVPYHEIDWLRFLTKATPDERAKWSFEPGGYAIYWEELDDGVEICHLLGAQSLV